eukprot:12234202-Karenia_brevis.AAC.1
MPALTSKVMMPITVYVIQPGKGDAGTRRSKNSTCPQIKMGSALTHVGRHFVWGMMKISVKPLLGVCDRHVKLSTNQGKCQKGNSRFTNPRSKTKRSLNPELRSKCALPTF